MPWPFRRRETLHEKLLREAGLDASGGAMSADPRELENSWFDERSIPLFERLSGEVAAARPRRWDAVVSTNAEGIDGDEVEFVTLPDGSLVIDEERGNGDLTSLAEAVETQLPAPYRARGVRQGEAVWAVAARKIQVVAFDAEGEQIELSVRDGNRTLSVDGAQEFGSIPELERVGSREGAAYVVRASRLDGDQWEVTADPL